MEKFVDVTYEMAVVLFRVAIANKLFVHTYPL